MITKLRLPEAGQVWRHHEGGVVRIIGLGYDPKGNVTVSYAAQPYVPGNAVHSQLLSRFIGSTRDDFPRFVFHAELGT